MGWLGASHSRRKLAKRGWIGPRPVSNLTTRPLTLPRIRRSLPGDLERVRHHHAPAAEVVEDVRGDLVGVGVTACDRPHCLEVGVGEFHCRNISGGCHWKL